MPGLTLGWSHVPSKGTKTLTRHGIPQLELWCLNLGILTTLALPWNGIMLMDSSYNVTRCWLPGSDIIGNKSWLVKCQMAHVQCVKFVNMLQRGIQHFDHSRFQVINICTRSFWRTIILILFTLYVSTQSATSSGNTLCEMSIAIGSLMNCISCSWV
jgi:hypothetical protein